MIVMLLSPIVLKGFPLLIIYPSVGFEFLSLKGLLVRVLFQGFDVPFDVMTLVWAHEQGKGMGAG
jgi:hypothetical protein